MATLTSCPGISFPKVGNYATESTQRGHDITIRDFTTSDVTEHLPTSFLPYPQYKYVIGSGHELTGRVRAHAYHRVETDSPLTQYITNAGISLAKTPPSCSTADCITSLYSASLRTHTREVKNSDLAFLIFLQ